MAEVDLIVLGGGSGGIACARRAAEYGANVVLFEPNRLGGTCVNVGCVPKKVMWYAAELAQGFRLAGEYGFDFEFRGHDFLPLKNSRDAYVRRLNSIYADNLEKSGVRHVRSVGVLSGPGRVEDSAGAVFEAPHIVVSTGGSPGWPGVEGQALGMSSDGFFELEALPQRTAVVGSGYIAVELAGVLHALGSSVSLFIRKDRVLRSFDSMLSDELMRQMVDSGIELVKGATPTGLARNDGLTLMTEGAGAHAGFDAVLWAIGRTPNSSNIGIESTGIELTDAGHIMVDEYQATSEPGIYAIGDVTGQAELTPVAIAAGRRLADRVFGGQTDRKLSYDLIPTVIFSHPVIGTVGLSEEAARDRYGSDVRVYSSRFVGMLNAITAARPRTAMKLVVTGPEELVVGCHIIGAGADEMLQGFAVAMSMGACKKDFDDTIAIHPTSAEELVTMR